MTTTLLKQGEILERLVRRDRMGISELSRKLHVSRRTIYNWFGQDRIGHEVIWQVGKLLGQDLSSSFPEAFPKYSEPTGQPAEASKQIGLSCNVLLNEYLNHPVDFFFLVISYPKHVIF